jgi:hypothetical protein
MQVVVTENITLDGVIELTGDWFAPVESDDPGESDIVDELRAQMQSQDGLLLGRSTFESFRGYWPQQDHDTTGITHHLNSVEKYVISNSLESPDWDDCPAQPASRRGRGTEATAGKRPLRHREHLGRASPDRRRPRGRVSPPLRRN